MSAGLPGALTNPAQKYGQDFGGNTTPGPPVSGASAVHVIGRPSPFIPNGGTGTGGYGVAPPNGYPTQPGVPGSTYPNTPSTNPVQPNPGEIAGLAPAGIQEFGGTPTVSPTYVQAAQTPYMMGNAAQQGFMAGNAALVDPNQNQAYMQQYLSLLGTAMEPTFQSQQQQLQDQLAARGISSSGAGQYLTNQLLGQEAAAYAGAAEPIVSQGYGYTQQDIQGNQGAQNQFGLANLGYGNQALGQNAAFQQQTNLANLGYGNQALGQGAAYEQQANLANAGYGNQAADLNAQYYNQDRYANAGAYNNFLNEMLGLGAGNFNALQAAYLNSFGPSTGVQSAYGNALSGMQGIYGNVYGSALGAQGQELGGAFGALGAAAAGG